MNAYVANAQGWNRLSLRSPGVTRVFRERCSGGDGHWFAALPLALLVSANACAELRFSDRAPGVILPVGWKPRSMSRHASRAKVTIVPDASTAVLRVPADHAAGAIARSLDLPAVTTLASRWKVDHSVVGDNLARKSGDDLAARACVLRAAERGLDVCQAHEASGRPFPTWFRSANDARCYVWDSHHPVGTMASNALYGAVRMIVLQSGHAHGGEWRGERRNPAADFSATFGPRAPRARGIALASDTDNTSGEATAWFGDISLDCAAAPFT